jgi:hypothetical protein
MDEFHMSTNGYSKSLVYLDLQSNTRDVLNKS